MQQGRRELGKWRGKQGRKKRKAKGLEERMEVKMWRVEIENRKKDEEWTWEERENCRL
jgi:hypothetical protein